MMIPFRLLVAEDDSQKSLPTVRKKYPLIMTHADIIIGHNAQDEAPAVA
jgi:hypothetical protein